MELSKEKRGHFLYCLFFLIEIFFVNIFVLPQCIVYTFRIYILLHIKKTSLDTLLLLVFKIIESLQFILNCIQFHYGAVNQSSILYIDSNSTNLTF